jgi:hypothetical protein
MALFGGNHTSVVIKSVSLNCPNNDHILSLLQSRNVQTSVPTNRDIIVEINKQDLVQNVIIKNDFDVIDKLLQNMNQSSINIMTALLLRFANENTVDYLLKTNRILFICEPIYCYPHCSPFLVMMERCDDNVEIINKICAHIEIEKYQMVRSNIFISALIVSIQCNNIGIFKYLYALCLKKNYLVPIKYGRISRLIMESNRIECVHFLLENNAFDVNDILQNIHRLSEPGLNFIVNVFIDYEEQGKISVDYPDWEMIKTQCLEARKID